MEQARWRARKNASLTLRVEKKEVGPWFPIHRNLLN